MAVARVVINDAALSRLLRGQDGAVVKAMADVGRKVSNEAKRRCPVDEGRLRASITSTTQVEGNLVVTRVGTPVEYALYVHNGTGIYGPSGMPITPKRGTGRLGHRAALRWVPRGGEAVYAFWVRGVKGRPFLTDALREVLKPLGWPITYRKPTGGPGA